MLNLLTPILSEKDPVESAEGGIDPLGTESIADALAVHLIPGVRERMQHPRLLTAIAVSLEVCREFEDDAIAKDGISEPWQIFEWYLVEGLVRSTDPSEQVGLPGRLKAAKAIGDHVPLSATRYLKTPAVFGFHGVYRQLARTLGIDQAGRLSETGFELLRIWSEEQGLRGFINSGGGPGEAVRRQLIEAVAAGLETGTTSRSSGWSGWEFFGKHLAPYSAGRKENEFLRNILLNDPLGFRRDVIEFLVSPDVFLDWQSDGSERRFYESLRPKASDRMRLLLDAIDTYEMFSRLCQDAFQDSLCELTRRGGIKTPPSELGLLPSVTRAAEQLPATYDQAIQRLEPFGEASRFRELFANLAEPVQPSKWAERLIEHHRKTQSNKPPNGKNPWIERFDDGSLMIRPNYRTDESGTHDNRYVHYYRVKSLAQFARDLRIVKA
jgi:hypothetical protein